MKPTLCVICGTKGNAATLYEERLGGRFGADAHSFSARRAFDSRSRIHHRFVRCDTCGLIRSDPILEPEQIADFYKNSEMLYEGDAQDIARVYTEYLKKAVAATSRKKSLLDIGCGDGFFLKCAMKLGFEDVRGVEPSVTIYQTLDQEMKGRIIPAMFRKGLYPKDTFDVICLFQTIEHVLDLNETIDAIFDILKPGGIFLVVSHNAGSLSAKILKDKSPIFDVVHINLFDKRTMRAVIEKHGFEVKKIYDVWNSYRFKYWFNYAPLHPKLKKAILGFANITGLANIRIPLRAGNIALLAQKPA